MSSLKSLMKLEDLTVFYKDNGLDCSATGFTDVTSSITCKVCPPTYIYTDSGLRPGC
jgi:hypothetical protein